MPTQSLNLLELKFGQLPLPSTNGTDGYAYYCGLCDEILVLSRKAINPHKVALVFAGSCPGCGFKLDKVMEAKTSKIPRDADLLANPKCSDGRCLLEPTSTMELSIRKSSIPDPSSKITTGIEALDQGGKLRDGK